MNVGSIAQRLRVVADGEAISVWEGHDLANELRSLAERLAEQPATRVAAEQVADRALLLEVSKQPSAIARELIDLLAHTGGRVLDLRDRLRVHFAEAA